MDETAVRARYLLRSATLLQSMREMYGTRATPTGQILRAHSLALMGEIVPHDQGALFLYDCGNEEWPEAVADAVGNKRPVFTASEIAMPLSLRDSVAGAIWLRRSEPFLDSEFELLAAISEIGSLALENAFHLEWLQDEVKRLERNLGIDELLGESAPIRELHSSIARIAPTEATVLVMGESGTGKELVARAIHRKSPRVGKPFVAINCAALSETLLESELFGHEKGAFTGALTQKLGKLEAANGGTVFLDEIGEMPVPMQAKLLRVLQQREVERVGGTKPISLNFRLIAATNRNLEDAARRGAFRQDLYYRLNVVALLAPPLRNRREDIVPLAQHFMARFSAKMGRKIVGMSPEARALLRAHEWPGNVRELENAIERAVVLGDSGMLLAEDLPDALRGDSTVSREGCGSLQNAVNAAKRLAVERAFAQSGDNHDEAARLLGVHPNYLYRLLKNQKLVLARRA